VVPGRIPPWILPPEEIQALHDGWHGTSPYLIYAKGVPDTPNLGQSNFSKKLCALILIEVGFSRDLGCDEKHTEKTKKYSHLVATLKQYWERVELVAIPIEHADTKLTRTLDHFTAAFFTVRPSADHTGANEGTLQPNMDSNAKSRDYHLFKSLMDALTDVAQSCFLGLIRIRKRLIDAL
jgi:hypothetical protein